MDVRTQYVLSGAAVGAGVSAPVAALAAHHAATLSWPVFLALCALTGAGGGALGANAVLDHRRIDPPQGDRRWVVAFLAPLVPVGAAAGYWIVVAPSVAVAVPLVVGAVLAFVGLVGTVTTAQRAHADRLTEAGETLVDLGPMHGERRRRLARRLGVVGAVAIGLVGAGRWALEGEVPFVETVMLFGALAPLAQSEQRVLLLEDGVRIGDKVVPYDDYDSFELTDDQLLLYGAAWWRGRIRVDRDRIDDEERVVAVLSERLERAG